MQFGANVYKILEYLFACKYLQTSKTNCAQLTRQSIPFKTSDPLHLI